jgi:hypothetical protein
MPALIEARKWAEHSDPAPWYQQAIKRVSDHSSLEIIVIVAILMNTVTLAVQDPNNTYSDGFNGFLDTLDLILTSIFTVEMFIRIFAMGLTEDTRTPYDLVFPGEKVEIMGHLPSESVSVPGEEMQALCERDLGGTRALRVKIAGLKTINPVDGDDPNATEVRGWLSVEEQEASEERRRTGTCICWPKCRKMTVVNGMAQLPDDLNDAWETDSLPKSLLDRKHAFRSTDQAARDRAQRKKQYGRLVEGGRTLTESSFGLPFPAVPGVPCTTDNGYLRYNETDRLEIAHFVRVTRGKPGGNMFEMDDEAVKYVKQEDGKMLGWEWSFPGRGRWSAIDERSAAMLHDGKETAAKEDWPLDQAVKLEIVDGFQIGGTLCSFGTASGP